METLTYYQNHKQYGNRFLTDNQLTASNSFKNFSGVMDKQARFIEENQLLIKEDWELFVEQFTTLYDTADAGWRGEYFGKMMRGACMTYQYTKNEKLYDILFSTAKKMLKTQDEFGRFSTYEIEKEFNGWDMWSRKYIILGLLHFFEICKDEPFKNEIVSALEKHLDYITEKIGKDKITIDKTTTWWGGVNSASILEPVVRMYNLTGKENYLDFAKYIIDFLTNSQTNIFALALENKLMPYQYPVRKAYEMMSCFEGLLEYYRVTKEEKYKQTVVNFVDALKETDITIIGCAGCEHELLNNSCLSQTDTDYKGIMQETCVATTWMKLCNQLLCLTGNPKYADYIETALYNTIHGAINNNFCQTNGGFMFDSYSPLTLGKRGRKIGGHRNLNAVKTYGCCVAIGAASTALPLLNAVNVNKNGIVFNFYENGEVEIENFKLNVKTAYPISGKIEIEIVNAPETESEISVRIPEFAVNKSQVLLNENKIEMPKNLQTAHYVTVKSHFKKGDIIKVDLNLNPRVVRAKGVGEKPQSKNFFAVLYGPLVLARDVSFTNVDKVALDNGEVNVKIEENPTFNCVVKANVSIGNTSLEMADYSSCGKTWDENSLMQAWIECE